MATLKTYYLISWNNGKSDRYIDEFNSKNGTSDENSAKFFDTNEEAENYIIKHDLSACYVTTLETEETSY